MVALSAVAVGSVLVSLFVVLMPDSAQAQTQTDDPSGCTNLVTPVPDQTIDPEVKLKSSPQNGGVIEFGSSRTPLLGRVQFPIETLPEATKIIAPVEVDVPMTKQGSVSPLKNAILVKSKVSGAVLDVEFCVNPLFPSELSAGTYDVTVRVTDPRFGPIDAVVAVTLQSGWTWFFFLAAIVTAGLAGAGAVLLAVFQQGVPGRGEWSRAIGVPERFFIGVAVGIGAILGWQVFERTVSGNPSWPGGSGGLLVLILAAGTAGYSISVFVAGIRAGFQGKRPNDAETDSQAQTGDDRSEPKDT